MNMQPRFTSEMDTFAKRAKQRRLDLGLNQATVADLSGLKQSDISKIENGLILKTTGLVALARALRCEPEWLATGDGQIASERVWPFALLTPDNIRQLSPMALESVEKLAISLLEIEGGLLKERVRPVLHADTVLAPRSKGFTGTVKKPDFMKDKGAQRSSDQGTPRKRRDG